MPTGKDEPGEFQIGFMDDRFKDGLKEFATRPAYKAEVSRLCQALRTWKDLHPGREPEWKDFSGLVMGGALDKKAARDYLAGNDVAHECIVWVDEHTERRCTMMQLQFALAIIGWRA